jgi:hypothetical protein
LFAFGHSTRHDGGRTLIDPELPSFIRPAQAIPDLARWLQDSGFAVTLGPASTGPQGLLKIGECVQIAIAGRGNRGESTHHAAFKTGQHAFQPRVVHLAK